MLGTLGSAFTTVFVRARLGRERSPWIPTPKDVLVTAADLVSVAERIMVGGR